MTLGPNLKVPPERKRELRVFTLGGTAVAVLLSSFAFALANDAPSAVAADDKSVVETVHANGVQIYECKASKDGQLAWQFREPLASLMIDGKTVGRHFTGPAWELEDGSSIKGKATAQAQGATAKDIPLLRLDVVEHSGVGKLAGVTTVQRLATSGGTYSGNCEKIGSMHLEPYSADYVFLK